MLQYICISIGKTNSSANCQYLIAPYLIMEMVKQTAVQPVSTGKFALHTKNRVIKRGLGRKNRTGKIAANLRRKTRYVCMGPLK